MKCTWSILLVVIATTAACVADLSVGTEQSSLAAPPPVDETQVVFGPGALNATGGCSLDINKAMFQAYGSYLADCFEMAGTPDCWDVTAQDGKCYKRCVCKFPPAGAVENEVEDAVECEPAP
jgi:hypothetical protein